MSTTLFSQNAALRGLLNSHLDNLAAEEQLDAQNVSAALEAGTMVLLGNPAHQGLKPILVGQPARIKVNANIGTSPLNNCPRTEDRKIQAALEAGADTVMTFPSLATWTPCAWACSRPAPAPWVRFPCTPWASAYWMQNATSPV